MELKSYQNICLHFKLPKNRIIYGWSLFYPNNTAIMLCATLFIRVCAHEGNCVSQCPFWRSSSVSKIRFFTIASVFYALNKMSTISELCILNTFVTRLSSSATIAPLCLRSLLIGYSVINNSSINTFHRNRSIPGILNIEICCSVTLSIFKY